MPAIQIDIITVSVQGYIECQEHVYVLGSFLRRFQSFKQAPNTLGLFPHPGIWLTIFSNIFRICATSLNWKVALLKNVYFIFPSIHWLELFCCRSTTQSCPTLCDPMDCRKPGLSVPHHLPKFTQVHVRCIIGAIQLSHPLMLSSPSAFNLSKHQGLFRWVSCLHQMTKIRKFQFQHQSFQQVFRVYFPEDWLGWSPCCPRDSRKLLQQHSWKASILRSSAFFTSFFTSSHNCMWPLGRP